MVTRAKLDAAQQQKLAEGLRELAFMIATAYRRRVTGEADTEAGSSISHEFSLSLDERTAQFAYPEDRRHEGEYIETVKVKTFLRKKAPQVWKSKKS